MTDTESTGAVSPAALQIGLMMPQTDGMRGPGTRRWSQIRDVACLAESIGFDSVWVVDHFLYHLEGEAEARGCWEAWSLLSALAAATSRVRLGTLVLGMGFRSPALLAKMAETVDEISDGRLILGVGAGYHRREYDAFGFPYDRRYSRFAEAIQIVHGLLRNGAIDFEGEFYHARDCELRPRGPRAKGPPIMIGSIGPKMMRLTARYADSWNVYYDDTENSAARVAHFRSLLDAACEAEGRAPQTLERTATVLIADAGADPWWSRLPTGRALRFAPLTGDPESIAQSLSEYAREGISHVQISLEPTTPAAVEALAPVLELLRR